MDIVEELRHKANNSRRAEDPGTADEWDGAAEEIEKLRRVVEDMSLQNRQLLAALQAVPQYFEVKKDNPL